MSRKFRSSKLPADQKGDGQRLQGALKAAKKRQVELALKLGVEPGNVSLWVTGRRPIPEDHLVTIAGFLGKFPEEISPSVARVLGQKVAGFKSLGSRHIAGSSSDPRKAQTPPPQQARIRGIATMSATASWQWTDMLPAEGSVPWNRPGCYALRVMGDAMHPRYKSGEYLIIREDAPIDADIDVLVVLKDGTAMIRELASIRDGRVALCGPTGARLTIEQSKIQLMHRVVGRSDASEVEPP